MEFIASLMGGLLLFFAGVQNSVDLARIQEPLTEYTCEEMVWTDPPVVQNDLFKGTLFVECEFKALSGGGFPQLRDYLLETIVNESQEVHAGPIEETYEGLPSTYYDTTTVFEEDGSTAAIRGEFHVATDEIEHLINDYLSKKISGSGMAGYVKKADLRSDVFVTDTDQWYRIEASAHTEIERPWYVPGSIFKDEVIKKIETEVENRKEEIINEVANNI